MRHPIALLALGKETQFDKALNIPYAAYLKLWAVFWWYNNNDSSTNICRNITFGSARSDFFVVV
jgi:hypothetical protein